MVMQHIATRVTSMAALLTAPFTVIAAPGDLDASFNGDGMVITDFGGDESALAVALRQDGRIVAAGQFIPSDGNGGFAIASYRANGQLDTTFDQDGKATLQFLGEPRRSGFAKAVVVQPDGKIVAGGTVVELSEGIAAADARPRSDRVGFVVARFRPNGDSNFALVRYLPNGKLDPSFGDRGVVITDFGGPNDFARALAIQLDGKIVVAGRGDATSGQLAFAVARYRPNGRPDTSFGNDGLVTTFVGTQYEATGLVLQADGRIVAVGQAFGAGSDIALVRYLANGALDSTFGGDGKALVDLGGADLAQAVAVQEDGKLVVAGFGDQFAQSVLVARFDGDGLLDTTFSGDGYVLTGIGSGGFSRAYALAIQPNGRILLAGQARNTEGVSDFALARYLAQ
jgi:uncharacterized delta-60 repeat protein